MSNPALNPAPIDAHRALVLDDRTGIVDLIELTLNHGQFIVRAAQSLAQAEEIVAAWHPDFAVIDMDHDDSLVRRARVRGAASGGRTGPMDTGHSALRRTHGGAGF